jgi:hypothetical protein
VGSLELEEADVRVGSLEPEEAGVRVGSLEPEEADVRVGFKLSGRLPVCWWLMLSAWCFA